MEEKIVILLESFLGEYSKQSGLWYSFNCPHCAEENLGPDDKYNLEVTIDPDEKGCGGFHCWKCGETNSTKGNLVKLFKQYAPSDVYDEFKEIIKDYRGSLKYRLTFGGENILDDIEDMAEVSLPQGFKAINKTEKDCKDAYDYLTNRGITDRIIAKHNIGYINKTYIPSLCKRVYIPSYDQNDNLTYWVGRDYTNTNKQKTKNPKISKTEIIFNEGLINWYEPITIVEGPFDHIVTPNSIPLLGKTLSEDSALFKALCEKAKQQINIFLDDDAINDTYKIYKRLIRCPEIKDNVRIIETPEGYDPSLIFECYGEKGILETLCTARKLSKYEICTR